ncbi:MAG: 6-phosphogluconolactonase [Firmicutes bacterium]|nr:6-phosphogluconolactonase [Bacillota bacterium]
MSGHAACPRLTIAQDLTHLVPVLADWILDQAKQAIAARGQFVWALPGGNTPKALFAYLAEPAVQARWPWPQIHLVIGDERDVHPTHPDSNFGMIYRELLARLSPPPGRVVRFWTECPPAVARAHYEAELAGLPRDASGYPTLDLALLGLGPEGHFASLFPQAPALSDTGWTSYTWVPQLGSHRYTLTLPVLCAAREVAFLAAGEEKRSAVQQAMADSPEDPTTPIAQLRACRLRRRPDEAWSHWFLDQNADSGLSSAASKV